jgi:hypothetical protein
MLGCLTVIPPSTLEDAKLAVENAAATAIARRISDNGAYLDTAQPA